jgi:ribulose-phosphate 3-epimerase
VRALLDRERNPAPIEVDGGIDRTNAARVVAAGAGILVAGNAIFGSEGADPKRAVGELRAAAGAAPVPFR